MVVVSRGSFRAGLFSGFAAMVCLPVRMRVKLERGALEERDTTVLPLTGFLISIAPKRASAAYFPVFGDVHLTCADSLSRGTAVVDTLALPHNTPGYNSKPPHTAPFTTRRDLRSRHGRKPLPPRLHGAKRGSGGGWQRRRCRELAMCTPAALGVGYCEKLDSVLGEREEEKADEEGGVFARDRGTFSLEGVCIFVYFCGRSTVSSDYPWRTNGGWGARVLTARKGAFVHQAVQGVLFPPGG